MPYNFTLQNIEDFAAEIWAEVGRRAVARWSSFNEQFFEGTLRPIPILLTAIHGSKRLAVCSLNRSVPGRAIVLDFRSQQLPGGNDEHLMHEMVHQRLDELGEASGHDSDGWRREIVRLTKRIAGKDIWAGRSKAVRQGARVIRINEPDPLSGRASLSQRQITCWPRECCVAQLRLAK